MFTDILIMVFTTLPENMLRHGQQTSNSALISVAEGILFGRNLFFLCHAGFLLLVYLAYLTQESPLANSLFTFLGIALFMAYAAILRKLVWLIHLSKSYCN
jgi:hypothetical protein